MKKTAIVMSVAVTILISGVNAFSEEKGSEVKVEVQSRPQTRDPITGDYINEKLYVDYNGKRIFVSSETSLAEVKKNPDKYIKGFEAKGVVILDISNGNNGQPHAQTKDPVTGDYINEKFYVDLNGKRIFASSETSLNEIKKNTDKYIKELEAKGVVLLDISNGNNGQPHPQTKDPITGDYINEKFYVDLNGKRIFASSETSLNEIKKNTDKYIKELEAKGVVLLDISNGNNGQPHAQTKDPITWDYINEKFYVDLNGKRIFASSETSLNEIKKNTDKYVKELEAKGVVLLDITNGKKGKPHAQTKDPVTGDYINEKLYVDYNGKRIFVSSETSIDEVKKNPDKYIKELEAKGVVLEEANSSQGIYK